MTPDIASFAATRPEEATFLYTRVFRYAAASVADRSLALAIADAVIAEYGQATNASIESAIARVQDLVSSSSIPPDAVRPTHRDLQVLVLCDLENLDHDAAASLLGIPADEVCRLHAAGRAHIGVDLRDESCAGWFLASRIEALTGPEQAAAEGHLAHCRACRDNIDRRREAGTRLLSVIGLGAGAAGAAGVGAAAASSATWARRASAAAAGALVVAGVVGAVVAGGTADEPPFTISRATFEAASVSPADAPAAPLPGPSDGAVAGQAEASPTTSAVPVSRPVPEMPVAARAPSATTTQPPTAEQAEPSADADAGSPSPVATGPRTSTTTVPTTTTTTTAPTTTTRPTTTTAPAEDPRLHYVALRGIASDGPQVESMRSVAESQGDSFVSLDLTASSVVDVLETLGAAVGSPDDALVVSLTVPYVEEDGVVGIETMTGFVPATTLSAMLPTGRDVVVLVHLDDLSAAPALDAFVAAFSGPRRAIVVSTEVAGPLGSLAELPTFGESLWTGVRTGLADDDGSGVTLTEAYEHAVESTYFGSAAPLTRFVDELSDDLHLTSNSRR